MAVLKDADVLLIRKHAAHVYYGEVILEIQNGTLTKIKHQEAELTPAGLSKRGKRK